MTETRKSGSCKALQLEVHPTSRQSFSVLIMSCITHQLTNSTVPHGIFRQLVGSYQFLAKFVLPWAETVRILTAKLKVVVSAHAP